MEFERLTFCLVSDRRRSHDGGQQLRQVSALLLQPALLGESQLLLLPVSAACCASLGSDPQGVASLGEATNLLNPESVTQKS